MNSSSRDKSHELVSAGVRHLSGWTDDALTSVTFTTTSDGQVAIIPLSRPAARNAWTEIMRNELARCLDAASKVKEIRAVIITGDPEGRAFCAGADLSPAGVHNPSSMEGDAPAGRRPDLSHWRDGGGTAGLVGVWLRSVLSAALRRGAQYPPFCLLSFSDFSLPLFAVPLRYPTRTCSPRETPTHKEDPSVSSRCTLCPPTPFTCRPS